MNKIFVIISSVIVLFLFSVYLFSQTRIVGDAASHLLLAVSPILKIGSPYKDFWDIKPPVLPLFLHLWSNLFGFGILSVRIFNIIMALFLIFISRLVYKKVFPTPVFEIIFLFSIIVVLSPLLNTIMIPTELLGLVLSMSALLALVGFRKGFQKFYFSGFLFFAASQTKEPFTFTALAILPLLINSLFRKDLLKLMKNLIQFTLGIITGFIGIYIYLASLGSVDAYKEVFRYKQVLFPLSLEKISQNFLPGFYAVERTFTEFPHGFSILIILAILSFYFANKFKKNLFFNFRESQLVTKSLIIFDDKKLIKYTVLFYALGSFLGFGLGESFSSHYLIQVVIPFYIIGGFIASYLFGNALFIYKRSRPYFYLILILFLFSLVVIAPKRQYFSSYIPKAKYFSMNDHVSGIDKRITELTTKDQCVLSVYGWGTGENYLYSMRRPCTRFFLANIVTQDWQKKEYAKDIIENPPALIIYQTAGADIDINKFESVVVNISKIVKNCYVRDMVEDLVYVPKVKNIGDLKNCVKVNSI